jgi:hypothetical protein
MLGGGGSPVKDFIIIRGLLSLTSAVERKAKIVFTLLDTSFFMLSASRRELNEQLLAIGGGERVDVNTVECDIMALHGSRRLLRSDTGSIIWFLTGGTLGNLEEQKFFDCYVRGERGRLVSTGGQLHKR